ncbi:hlh transcription [Phlyctema vagabunda]|uniref:Hlh transcription n=1 Tax=Phlyctema vagabunda TaxID=108571 RepID=A0ABR4PV33_9HELO
MLLTRHHGMGSSKPSDQEMPFGYTFPDNADTRIPSPVDPPHGPELLDDNDNKYMQTFFNEVGNNAAPYDFDPSFFMEAWEIPPEFVGTASSFGPPPPNISHTQPIATSTGPTMNGLNMDTRAQDGSYHHMDGNLGMHHSMPSTTPDVYRAASTLIGSNPNARHQSMGSETMFSMQQGDNMMHMNGHSMHHPLYPSHRPRSMQDVRPPQELYTLTNYYANPFAADLDPRAISNGADSSRAKGKEVEIKWGSDMGFGSDQGFIPPPGQESVEDVEREHIRRVKSFAPVAESLPINEPIFPARAPSPRRRKSTPTIKTEEDDGRLRKKRKSKFLDEEDEDRDEEVAISSTGRVSASKKRKSISNPIKSPSSPVTEPPPKRRRSNTAAAAAAAAKATRENLSEEQKRENHIKSEQKRRTLIRDGFAALNELVPNLQGGGYSKSTMLLMAAEFLERLLDGNKELETRVAELESSG